MKLAAIYNVWDGEELLMGSIDCIKNHVDVIVIVYQTISNFGEVYNPLKDIEFSKIGGTVEVVTTSFYTPTVFGGRHNETAKRNQGMAMAQQLGCTHFINMDCDEYYVDFGAAKEEYIRSGSNGSVCRLFTYFKRPTWRCDKEDGYYVPFIHKFMPGTVTGAREYPFYVDPTRRINEKDVVLLTEYMHHFSWVRADIGRKIRNGSHKDNIAAGTLVTTYNSPYLEENPEGFYIPDWDRHITVVDNIFNINI